jgi:hypothetical protein
MLQAMESNCPGGNAGNDGCATCMPDSATAAWQAKDALEHLQMPVDDSHFIVNLCRCTKCGQHFVTVFTEMIDWYEGDDAQHRVLLPIDPAEYRALASLGQAITSQVLEMLGPTRRSLHMDHPTGGSKKFYWSTGLRVGPHH